MFEPKLDAGDPLHGHTWQNIIDLVDSLTTKREHLDDLSLDENCFSLEKGFLR